VILHLMLVSYAVFAERLADAWELKMLGVSCVLMESSRSLSGGGDQAAEFWLRFTIRLTRTLVLNDEARKENCGRIPIFRHDLYTIWRELDITQI
jgi:hypothetical protein